MSKDKDTSLTFDRTILNPLLDEAVRTGKSLEEQTKNVQRVYRLYTADNDVGDLAALSWFIGYTSRVRTKLFAGWDFREISMRKLRRLAKEERASKKKSRS